MKSRLVWSNLDIVQVASAAAAAAAAGDGDDGIVFGNSFLARPRRRLPKRTKTLSQTISLNTELGAADFHNTSANIHLMFKKEKANADEENFSSICSTLDSTSVR